MNLAKQKNMMVSVPKTMEQDMALEWKQICKIKGANGTGMENDMQIKGANDYGNINKIRNGF